MPITSRDQKAARTRQVFSGDWFQRSTVWETVVGAGREEMLSWLLLLLPRGLSFPRVLPGGVGPVVPFKLSSWLVW